jgi:hypothetical protein
MSRIYFHTSNRTVEVLGSERAYMSCLTGDVALAVLRPDEYEGRERLTPGRGWYAGPRAQPAESRPTRWTSGS